MVSAARMTLDLETREAMERALRRAKRTAYRAGVSCAEGGASRTLPGTARTRRPAVRNISRRRGEFEASTMENGKLSFRDFDKLETPFASSLNRAHSSEIPCQQLSSKKSFSQNNSSVFKFPFLEYKRKP